jgi:(E)-4-hydroxy-3-methylbut-2-enyl-diphosphate synthase
MQFNYFCIPGISSVNQFLKQYSNPSLPYCRIHTRIVQIGELPMGGNLPIRIQSMTSTNTMDTKATVEQAIRMIDAGCEYVRITAPGIREAENLALIKKQLLQQGYRTPLIADIHFNPAAAEVAARIVEKIRINPGNYADRVNKSGSSFTESEYAGEIERIRDRIKPLLAICHQYGTALRIGVNHGSLSERIMNRYGDTPDGMVQSALEFIHICADEGFHNLVLSMKSSNVRVMVHATRLLVSRMLDLGMDYPIHLGVTEAGDGEDGRIKSAAGIGTLLEDGIGDTIRVSLTEDPELELPVAKGIVERYNISPIVKPTSQINSDEPVFGCDPFSYQKRYSAEANGIASNRPPVVIVSAPENPVITNERGDAEYRFNNDKIKIAGGDVHELRQMVAHMEALKDTSPIILRKSYSTNDPLKFQLDSAIECGSMLIDGIGDGLWLDAGPEISPETIYRTAFAILQATRTRITRTEFISCPSCGRTQFNIQETLHEIKNRTGHLTGLKLAVMGCIVNGPGEMADADYGYVGAGNGRISLYKGREIIRKNIAQSDAVDALIELLKENGDWKEPGS